MVYSLTGGETYIIETNNKNDKNEKVTLGINHQEIMILPFDQDLPLEINPKEDISLMVEIRNSGYLELEIKKCLDCSPYFSYTFDYDGFQKGDF